MEIKISIAADINRHHQLASDKASEAVHHATEAGKLLLEVKATLPHGQFGEWMEKNISISSRQAQRYMGVAQGKPGPIRSIASKNDTVSYLPEPIPEDLPEPDREPAPLGRAAIDRAEHEAACMRNATRREAEEKEDLELMEEMGPEIGPTDEELSEALQWEADQLVYARKILSEEDDPLAKAIADAVRHSAMVEFLTSQAHGKQGEYKARADQVIYWQNQATKERKRADKAERELARLTSNAT